jgi:hypothetical protein
MLYLSAVGGRTAVLVSVSLARNWCCIFAAPVPVPGPRPPTGPASASISRLGPRLGFGLAPASGPAPEP